MVAKHKTDLALTVAGADCPELPAQGALNINQAAAYSGVRCSAIEAAVRDGELRGRRLGRTIIILKSDLDAFLSALEVIPAHTPRSVLKRREEQSRRMGNGG